MYGLQVECGLVGVAAEDDGASLLELEILLDDVLYCHFVGAVVNGIGALHLERAFVVIGGLQRTRAVEGDVVAGLGVHQDAHGSVGLCIDQEIHVDIGPTPAFKL